jgi:peptidylprolyl isomerase
MDRRLAILIAFAAGLAVVIGVVLIAQGGDEDDGGDPCEAEAVGDLGKKPEISVTGGAAPDDLVSEDIEPGDGKAAAPGDDVAVQYVGVDCATGEEFDASWDRGEPFEFTLGEGGVIPGWDEGVVGMKEGGRRLLVIPPELAYGAEGQPPDIGPNATLVFVIDLESVK